MVPTLRPDERVVFIPHFMCGLGFPLHPFIRGMMFYYGIDFHDLSPNLLMHIFAFITLCEAFLWVQPHFGVGSRLSMSSQSYSAANTMTMAEPWSSNSPRSNGHRVLLSILSRPRKMTGFTSQSLGKQTSWQLSSSDPDHCGGKLRSREPVLPHYPREIAEGVVQISTRMVVRGRRHRLGWQSPSLGGMVKLLLLI